MNKLIEIGKEFIGISEQSKQVLIAYYNENCVSMVQPARRYHMKPNDNWCAMFVSVLAHKAGLNKVEFPYEVSVHYMREIAKSWGIYSTNKADIKQGDLILYDWDSNGSVEHVGIVSDVMGAYVEVLEGNYRKTVGMRVIDRNSRAVAGVVRLPRVAPNVERERLQALVRRTIIGEFGNGIARVEALGADYEAVQRMVNDLVR